MDGCNYLRLLGDKCVVKPVRHLSWELSYTLWVLFLTSSIHDAESRRRRVYIQFMFITNLTAASIQLNVRESPHVSKAVLSEHSSASARSSTSLEGTVDGWTF